MTSLAVTRTTTVAENRSWLASAHGTDPGTTPGCTLDVTTFSKAEHYPDGFIRSGIVLGKITASGLYGPYDAEAQDGREVAAGHLFGSLPIPASGGRVGGALLVHGFVTTAKLPANHGLDSDAMASLSMIHYS